LITVNAAPPGLAAATYTGAASMVDVLTATVNVARGAACLHASTVREEIVPHKIAAIGKAIAHAEADKT
jgi:hypothetical protein